MTEAQEQKHPAPRRQLGPVFEAIAEFGLGFWIGYTYIGPWLRDQFGLNRLGAHRAPPQPVFRPVPDDRPGHVVIVPPEAVGCECWCHRGDDEWIGG